MDRRNTKRPRESSLSSSSSSSSSSAGVRNEQSSQPEIGNGEKRQHVEGFGRLFDLDLSFGVFDFPWLKDSLIYSKYEDWKVEDVFFTSFDGVSTTADIALTEWSEQLVWCNLPDPWEEEYEAHVAPATATATATAVEDGEGPAGEGMDCVWNSLLNQPLQQGSSSAL